MCVQDLNTRASVLQTEVQNNIAEFQNSLSESLKDSRNMIGETIKRTKSMEMRFLDVIGPQNPLGPLPVLLTLVLTF